MGEEWLQALAPSSDRDVVLTRLSRTSELMSQYRFADPLPLPPLADTRDAMKRARPEGSMLDPDSFLRLFQIAHSSRRIRQYFSQREDAFPSMAKWSEPLVPLKAVEDAILAVITDTGLIRDNASPELQQIRKSLQSRRNDLRTALARILRQASKDGILSENEPTIRGGRMVLAIRAEHKRRISGFIHDTSATGHTVYLEPADVLHINNDIRQLEQDELREIERILRNLTSVIREHRIPLERNGLLLGELDGMRSVSIVSCGWNGVIADLRKDGKIVLMGARNPILGIVVSRESKVGEAHSPLTTTQVVPLNLELGRTEQGLIITGPNAGGKSVALKTVGLCVLLTQSGFAIPADEGSGMPLIDVLSVDMGDDQSIENDLSTFSSRLAWIRDTLNVDSRPYTVGREEGPRSTLILIDEAASGTDPEEGVALYQALMETLLERGARLIVTTHHGALKVFAHNHPGMVNGSMEFDREGMSPTYRFRKGIPGSSYAFEIAQRIGVPTSLTQKARALIGDNRNTLEGLIADLETATKAASDHEKDLATQLKTANRLISEYKEKLQTMTHERDKIREKALIEAKSIMMEANRTVERVVEEIRVANASKEAIKKARKELRDGAEPGEPTPGPSLLDPPTDLARRGEEPTPGLNDSHDGAEPGEPTPGPSLPDPKTDRARRGDWVRLRGTETTGEIVEISGKNAFLMVNGMKMRAKLDSLDVDRRPNTVDGKKIKSSSGWTLINSDPDDTAHGLRSTVLDLRGMRGEEAVAEVERFVDQGFAAGLQLLEIIHGKGDGILRKRIHEYLRQRKDVSSFRLAPWEQGGPGVTLVGG